MESRVRPWLTQREAARIDELIERYGDVAPASVPALAAELARRSDTLLDREVVNLYAGTNVVDPAARALLATGLGSRPSLGHPGDKYEMGLQHAEELEVLCLSLARRLFACRYVEFRVLSGSLANLYAFMALAQPGDTILSLPERAGGHATHRPGGAAGLYGLRILDVPWDDARMSVDLDPLAEMARRERPRIILLGGSLVLFPYPVAAVRAIAAEVGAYVMYDAAHVSALIAEGGFQRPLHEGAHVVTMSTYKSLGGPSGGLIISDDPDVARKLERVAYPGLSANFDLGRLAALAVALAGFLNYGTEYVAAMKANAAALAQSLADEGFDVTGNGDAYTYTHHVALAAQPFGGGTAASRTLEPCRILTSGIGIPGPGVPGDYAGLRMGTQEVTRWGMRTDEMRFIAHAMADCLFARRPAPAIRDDVAALRAGFQRLHFVLDEQS